MLRQRRPAGAGEEPDPCSGTGSSSHAATSEPGVIKQSREPGYQPGEQHPLLKTNTAQATEADGMPWVQRNHWIVLAVASGACAAFNGVFAKLTTGDATVSFAQGIAGFFHLDSIEGFVEYFVRAAFFGLNLLFNGVMWALFTKALARGNSTTQVSIMNTSSNFFITAILGLVVFSEVLPPLWWVGATFLVAGNVIIGSKDEGGKTEGDEGSPSSGQDSSRRYEMVPETDGDVATGFKDHEDEDNNPARRPG